MSGTTIHYSNQAVSTIGFWTQGPFKKDQKQTPKHFERLLKTRPVKSSPWTRGQTIASSWHLLNTVWKNSSQVCLIVCKMWLLDKNVLCSSHSSLSSSLAYVYCIISVCSEKTAIQTSIHLSNSIHPSVGNLVAEYSSRGDCVLVTWVSEVGRWGKGMCVAVGVIFKTKHPR